MARIGCGSGDKVGVTENITTQHKMWIVQDKEAAQTVMKVTKSIHDIHMPNISDTGEVR